MKYTIKDVAREAGVSTATVSMVLSGKGKISDEKKEIVMEAINKLGYKRQRSASRKNLKQKGYIGLIVFCDFDFQWWFAKDFVLAIKNKLLKSGYYTLMFHCDNSTDPQYLFDRIMDAGLSGVMSLHYNNRNLFTRLVSQNMPLVLVNNSNHQSEFHTVCADDYQGSYEGAKKLIGMGHKELIYLDYNRPQQPATVMDRLFGFRKAMEEASLPFPENRRIQVELDDMDTLKNKLKECLDSDKKITACFIHDDYFAARVLKTLNELNISVPHDLSIMAPGDTLPYQEPFVPSISTMQIDGSSMGEQAVNMMKSLLADPAMPVQVIKTMEQFVDRGSCIKKR